MNYWPHFALREFACKDGTAYPSEWIETRLNPLRSMLEEIRSWWGVPIVVRSGYRTPEWNRKVGGAAGSQHLVGRAADIEVPGVALVVVSESLRRRRPAGLGGLGIYWPEQVEGRRGFVHVDMRPGRHLVVWHGGKRRGI